MDEVRIPTYTPSYLLKRCADFIIAIRRVVISQPLALARLLDCDWRLWRLCTSVRTSLEEVTCFCRKEGNACPGGG